MLMNYYRHIDRNQVQFDFLCNKTKPGAYDDEVQRLGGRIYHTPGLNPAKYPLYLKYMKKLFAEHPEYKIVEAHNGALGVYALHAAKVNNIPVRIYHAHGASITKDWKLPLMLFCRSRLAANITERYTCGKAAAECYYGKEVVEKGNYDFIPNAIEVDRFLYNPQVRDKMRQQYQLEGKHVIGHVGRFMAQKNHTFLLDVFAAYKKEDKDAYLVLLGDGELMETVKNKAKELGVADSVLFVGNVGNANEWYQAFDVFMLPSIWEGLPVVGVEAQAADLPCIFSDNVTKEIGLSDKASFLSLHADMSSWVSEIRQKMQMTQRVNQEALITENRYNIEKEAVLLQERYLKLYGENTL